MFNENLIPVNEIAYHEPPKRGRKAEKFLVLDCETATLPFIGEYPPEQKKTLALLKPLIYDIAWLVVDRKGTIYSKHSFLVQETFFVPQVFNTAYYSWKRPLYMERYETGEIVSARWEDILNTLLEECEKVSGVYAYNAQFDFKKAIPFTDTYIRELYTKNYNKWEESQKKQCERWIKQKPKKNPDFDCDNFTIRKKSFPMFDLWKIAADVLINEEKYKKMCLENGLITPSGLYFKTSAETTFQYLIDNLDFQEEHTALKDTEIETEILLKALKKAGKNLAQGVGGKRPFQELGTTVDFIIKSTYKNGKPKYSLDIIDNVLQIIFNNYQEYNKDNSYLTRLANSYFALERYKNEVYKNSLNIVRSSFVKIKEIERMMQRIENYLSKNDINISQKQYEKQMGELQRLDNYLCHYAEYAYKKN